MIELERVVSFDWDAGNSRKNDEHGVSQSEAEQVFFDPRLLMVPDLVHSAGESRFQALGRSIEGRYLHITFTLRSSDTLIRIISARDVHQKERARYDRKD